MKKPFFYDERLVGAAGKIAAIVLPLTQVALGLAVVYRAYVLNQPDHEFNDLRIILGLSIVSYIGASLYWGGYYPVLKIRTLLIIYFVFVVVLFTICSIIYGLPTLDNWMNTLLPALVAPAILVGLYAGVAYLGQRRIEKELSALDDAKRE